MVGVYQKTLLSAGSLRWCAAQGEHHSASLKQAHQRTKQRKTFLWKNLSAGVTCYRRHARLIFIYFFFSWLYQLVSFGFEFKTKSVLVTNQTDWAICFPGQAKHKGYSKHLSLPHFFPSVLEESFLLESLNGCLWKRYLLPLRSIHQKSSPFAWTSQTRRDQTASPPSVPSLRRSSIRAFCPCHTDAQVPPITLIATGRSQIHKHHICLYSHCSQWEWLAGNKVFHSLRITFSVIQI